MEISTYKPVLGRHLVSKPRVSPGLDAAAAEHRNGSGLLDAVDLMDSSDDEEDGDNDDDEDLPEATANAQLDGSALLDAVDAIDSDDNVEEIADTSGRQEITSPSRLQDAVESDDEEQLKARSNPPGRTTTFMSGAALDLCPTVDLTNLSDTDSSSSSCFSSSEEEDESGDSDSDVDFEADGEGSDDELVDKRTAAVSAPRLSSWESDYLPVSQVDAIIRSNMAEIEAKKPWRFVFRCLEIPFQFKRRDDPFDLFFLRWDEFWRVHGRAVWERDFWQPLVPGSTEYHRRKGRQFRAQRAFRAGNGPGGATWEALPPVARQDAARWLVVSRQAVCAAQVVPQEPPHVCRVLGGSVKDRWPRGRRFLVDGGLKPMWWLSDFGASATDEL